MSSVVPLDNSALEPLREVNNSRGMTSLRIVSCRSIPEDPELKRAWNELVYQMDRPEVFYTYEWALAMERAYGHTLQPWIFLGYEDENLVGAVALARGPSDAAVTFLGVITADYCNFVTAPQKRARFIDAVFAELKNAAVGDLTFASVPLASASVTAIAAAASKYGFHMSSHPAATCARVNLPSEERNLLKKNAKHKLQRKLKAWEKKGPVAIRHRQSWEEVEGLIPAFLSAHVARFLTTGRISNIARVERQVFLSELAKLLSRAGWFMLSILDFCGRPAAWNYGFVFAGNWFWYQPTFDSKYGEYSPGSCLLAGLVAEACDKPNVDSVDLGIGDEAYKDRFANAANPTVNLELTSSRLRLVSRFWRRKIVEGARKSNTVERLLRNARERFRRLHGRVKKSGTWNTIRWLASRLTRLVISRDEVWFYEWPTDPDTTSRFGALKLVPLTFETLGAAGLIYGSEQNTMDYLRRTGGRFADDHVEGYALVDENGRTVHFAWTTNRDEFYVDELKFRLPNSDPNAAMIFDCWTPESARGRGYYGIAASLVACNLVEQGRAPWIFASAANAPSSHALAKTMFTRRYSLVRRHFLMWNRIKRIPKSPAAKARSASV